LGDRDVENGLLNRYLITVQVVATFIPLQRKDTLLDSSLSRLSY
jgi:hypothetical protein